MGVAFRAFPQFNTGSPAELVSSTSKLSRSSAEKAFGRGGHPDRFVLELAAEQALPTKEIVETFEFFERIRKEVRGPQVVDLCAGHGLLGLLFAAFERSVEQVLLLDRRTPANYDRVMVAMHRAAPWVEDKVVRKDCKAEGWGSLIGEGSGVSVVSAHACGELTDRCLEVAMEKRCRVAVMPCCYPWRACPGPAAIKRNLGVEMAIDIDRTYRLERAGYSVLWRSIPESITPMNRILIGKPHNRA